MFEKKRRRLDEKRRSEGFKCRFQGFATWMVNRDAWGSCTKENGELEEPRRRDGGFKKSGPILRSRNMNFE